jgi:hypothetical protein
MAAIEREGTAEAVVLIKAAPQVSQRHGETVCCAAVDLHGNWLRLYPVAFRTLDDGQRFGRWDRIRFKWRRPRDDMRIESRRVDQDSIEIVGSIKPSERERFLKRTIVSGLVKERQAGRSLALLKATIEEFLVERRSPEDIAADVARFAKLRAQPDLFNAKAVIPYSPCTYRFKYRYRTDDGERTGTCQDWEIEATFFNWSRRYGEEPAVAEMRRVFGEEYPRRGMLLAMGTHSLYPDVWLINGVVRLDDHGQEALI